MLIKLLDGDSIRAARTALTGLARRQEAISGNIANIDTPGYRRREVTFERSLEASLNRAAAPPGSLARTDPRHLAGGTGGGGENPNVITPRTVASSRNDGNAVSIDEEMTLLAETQIRFQALTQTLGRRLSTLRTVIRG